MRLATKWLAMGLMAISMTACQAEDPNAAGVSGKQVRTTGTAAIGGAFSLVDDKGADVTEADLLGKPHLIYFGFAYCPDVCPTSLQKMGAAQQLMGKAGDDVGYVLITVDPERDTVEKIAQYISFEPFPTELRGFTGTVEQVNTVKDAFKVSSSKRSLDGGAVEPGSDEYTVDHSDIIYFMDENGVFADFFSSKSTPQDIAVRVRQELMSAKK